MSHPKSDLEECQDNEVKMNLIRSQSLTLTSIVPQFNESSERKDIIESLRSQYFFQTLLISRTKFG